MDGRLERHEPTDVADCPDEAAQIAAAQADPAAFGPLYRAHLPQLYAYLRSRSRSDDSASDLTQQVFLRALEALPGYRDRGIPFRAWLFRIARNALIDAARRERVTIPWEQLPEAHHLTDLSQPDQPGNQDAALAEFHSLIAPLDEGQRELLILRFVVGLPTRDIAAVLGKQDGAVRMQLSRSLRTLKETIDVS